MIRIAIAARTNSATGDKMAKAAYGHATRHLMIRLHSSRRPFLPLIIAVMMTAASMGPNEAK
jgi:hypothetical protein